MTPQWLTEDKMTMLGKFLNSQVTRQIKHLTMANMKLEKSLTTSGTFSRNLTPSAVSLMADLDRLSVHGTSWTSRYINTAEPSIGKKDSVHQLLTITENNPKGSRNKNTDNSLKDLQRRNKNTRKEKRISKTMATKTITSTLKIA